MLVGGTRDDDIDGGSGRDLVFGDNVVLDRTTPLRRLHQPALPDLLTGTQIYSTAWPRPARPWSTAPRGSTRAATPSGPTSRSRCSTTTRRPTATGCRFGGDYIAGGPGDDMIFGQLGNDTIQGDGTIDNGAYANRGSQRPACTITVGTRHRCWPPTATTTSRAAAATTSIFGDLGRDDIIGGSSDLFVARPTMAQRPDVNDLIFGGAGAATGRNDQYRRPRRATPTRSSATTATSCGWWRPRRHGRHRDAAYLTFTYDTYGEAGPAAARARSRCSTTRRAARTGSPTLFPAHDTRPRRGVRHR